MIDPPYPQLAADCLWLRRKTDPTQPVPYTMTCGHIIREDRECVGPFIQGIGTDCKLWSISEHARARSERRLPQY
jgi:hypothetical protein